MTEPRYGVPQERDWNALSDGEFRKIVRAEVEEHYPPELRYPARRLMWDEQKDWVLYLARRGWLAPGWPVELGGMGLSAVKQIIYVEEFERWGVGRYVDHGVVQVGPVIMRFGTQAQQNKWLAPILSVEHRWAQGYSEPEAGSDLASLRTRARRASDEYVIDGQKIWTTQAHDATHIYVLARTNADVKQQLGISFLLVDLSTPGITVRPIRDIAGHQELCEVFFDGVRVPAENLIGEENMGWTVAKSLLGHERINLGSPKLPEYGLQILRQVATASGALEDPVFQDRFVTLQLDVAHLADAYGRYVGRLARGEQLGPDVSWLKIWATETVTRIADLILESAGEAAALAGEHVAVGDREHDVLGTFYKARPSTIYGGSNEIQRNILASAVLELPRG
jgi:alkylation response protein AidB-like acyl-CoA dehydrogenase